MEIAPKAFGELEFTQTPIDPTEKRVWSDIGAIIRGLESDKTHDVDNIMVKRYQMQNDTRPTWSLTVEFTDNCPIVLLDRQDLDVVGITHHQNSTTITLDYTEDAF